MAEPRQALGRLPVSVIVPTYNRAHTIERALASILAQVDEGDEIIVVDDGSVDNTRSVVAGFGEAVRYISQSNAGPGAARNRGIGSASHDLIVFLDSDDVWTPGKLDLQCALMQARPDLVMSFADLTLHYPDGRTADSAISRWQPRLSSWEELLGAPPVTLSSIADWPAGNNDPKIYIGSFYRDLMDHCPIHCNTAMIRRSLAGDALIFPECINIYEDWACFARLAGRGPVAFADCCVSTQIIHATGRLTDCDEYARVAARIWVLEEIWGADPDFLGTGIRQYRALLDTQRILKAKLLNADGRTAEARDEFRRVSGGFPISHFLLSALPGPVARLIYSAWRGYVKLRRR